MEVKELLEKFQKDTVEGVAKAVEPLKEEVKVNTEALAKANEVIAKQDKEIADLQKHTAETKVFNINKIDRNIKINGVNWNLDNQGGSILDKAYKSVNRERFSMFKSDSEAFFNFKKEMLLNFKASVAQRLGQPHAQELNKHLAELRAEKATMIEGTDARGGYGVPEEYSNEFFLLVREDSTMLDLVSMMTMGSDVLNFAGELTGFTVYYPGEGSAITASTPTQTQVVLTAKKAAILSEGVSSEVIEDSNFDLVGYLTEAMSYAMAQDIDNQILNGVAAPWGANVGLLTAAVTNEVEVSGAPTTGFAGLTDEDMSEAAATVSDKFAQNGTFVMNRLARHYIRTLKDTAGQPIYVAPSAPSIPGTVYGYPVRVCASAVNTTAADTSFIVFGDMKQFLYARRSGGFNMEADPYTLFSTDYIRFRMKHRHAIAIKNAAAFCRIATTA